MIKTTLPFAVLCAMIGAGMAGVSMPSTVAAAERLLEEMVVTATRRDSNIMDVPASVTAFNAETIDSRQVRSIEDLNALVPNWRSEEYNGQMISVVRGIHLTIVQGPQESTMATHVNGAYITRTNSMRAAYMDLESIEVMRGPQGTLYGRNATAGNMNILTAKPTDEFEGRVSAFAGNFDRIGGSLMLSGPLTENFLARVAVTYDDRDAYYKNLHPGGDEVQFQELFAGKLALRWLPSEAVTVDLTFTHEEWKGSSAFQPYTPPTDILFPIYTDANFTLEPHEIYADAPQGDDREDQFVSLNVEWDVSDTLTVRSITGYSHNDFDQAVDSDGTDVNSTPLTYFSESDSFSQELILDFGLADGQLDVLLGGFYYEDDVDFGFFVPAGFLADLLGLPVELFSISNLFDQGTTAYATFVDATYHISEDVRVYGGVRASWEQKDAVIEALAIAPQCGFGLPVSELDDDWDDVSPRIGVQWDFSDSGMFYGQYQKGFKSGGFSSGSCADVFDPEQVDSFEVGLKMTLNEGRSSLLTSVFVYDYTDLQVQQLIGLQTEVTNAAESSIWGLEFEATHLLGDLTTIGLRYSYLDAEYDEFTNCDALLFPGNCTAFAIEGGFSVGEDLSGNRLVKTPEHTIGVTLNQEIPISEGELDLGIDLFWTDETEGRIYNREAEKLDDYTMLNAFLTYRPGFADNASIRLFGKNLLDEEYVSTILANGGLSFNLQSGGYMPPRTWGVEVVLDF